MASCPGFVPSLPLARYPALIVATENENDIPGRIPFRAMHSSMHTDGRCGNATNAARLVTCRRASANRFVCHSVCHRHLSWGRSIFQTRRGSMLRLLSSPAEQGSSVPRTAFFMDHLVLSTADSTEEVEEDTATVIEESAENDSAALDTAPESWIEIGSIVAPHGVRGELKVASLSDFPERFLKPGPRWLARSSTPARVQKPPREVMLLSGRATDKGFIVKLEGVTTRDEAEVLRGSRLLVRASDRPPLEAGEYHVRDLIGLDVVLHGSDPPRVLGRVTELRTAGQDLLEVRMPDRVIFYVPFVTDLVPVVDLDRGCVEIDPPRGLVPGL